MNRLLFLAYSILLALLLVSCNSGIQRDLPISKDLVASATTPGSITVQVSSSADDAEQNNSTGGVALTNSRLPIGVNGGVAQTVGIRFRNLTIPKDATITSAVLEVKASASLLGTTNFTIKGEAADNAASYTTANNGIGSRAKTTASSSWKPEAWTSGSTYQTQNLQAIIQQIVNRNGWQSGNALALQITGTGIRKAKSFETGAVNAPKLIISYTTQSAPPPTDPVVEAALQAIETDTRFLGLATALDRDNVVANVTQAGVALYVPELNRDRSFISVVRNNEIDLLVRFEADANSTGFFDVLQGRSASLDALSAYGDENGIGSNAQLRAFAKEVIPMLEDDYVNLNDLSLPGQSSTELQASINWLGNDCQPCQDRYDEAVDATGNHVLDIFESARDGAILGGAIGAGAGSVGGGGGTAAGAGVGAAVGAVTLSLGRLIFNLGEFERTREAYRNCRQTSCQPELVGPNPPSFRVFVKVGESFNGAIVFSNDTNATAPLEFIHNGGNWPGISGPVTGQLDPGQQHPIPLQYTCTTVGIVDQPVRISTNDADESTVDVPVRLECVEGTRTEMGWISYGRASFSGDCPQGPQILTYWGAWLVMGNSSGTQIQEEVFFDGPVPCAAPWDWRYYNAEFVSWSESTASEIYSEYISQHPGNYSGLSLECPTGGDSCYTHGNRQYVYAYRSP